MIKPMMNPQKSLKSLPTTHIFRPGDVFVLFGELFGRGYANGLVNEARNAGMDIIGITVGRRDEHNALRPLTDEELATAEAHLGGRIINVPLMAGFDLDAPAGTPTPTDMLGSMTLKNWADVNLDWSHIDTCRALGVQRFKDAVAEVMATLNTMIPDGRNVFFAHTMAGGIPKAKVFLAIANRIYKGSGDRFMSSRQLLDSDLGKLILQNFDEVTAHTFQHLMEGSSAIRKRMEASGGEVRYSAYGYHGTEILIDGSYQWQTYTSYTQGYAKMRLERIAESAWDQGIKAVVYNCPEIRTNSSDIFVGVELPLIALLLALQKEDPNPWTQAQWQACADMLLEGCSLDDVLGKINAFNGSEVAKSFRDFAAWPMSNTAELADIMIGTSEAITKMHKDRKSLITDHLSSLVIEAVGPLMFKESSCPSGPVLWINHDIIAKQLNELHR
ncbi:enoyl-acyl carrier protein reductase FabMG [Leptothrix ochracea]|uniref:enoyl ACP reductase FabMG family protein n=1 Tax=Leptothrix ochracea TaxID=735331 RepID=UPI0034E2DC57